MRLILFLISAIYICVPSFGQDHTGTECARTGGVFFPVPYGTQSVYFQNPQDDLMKKIRTRSWISGAMLISNLASGYMLSNSDFQEQPVLFTSHKLVAVGNLVLMDLSTFQKGKKVGLSTAEKIAAISMNVCFISTIGTGGAISTGKPMPDAVYTLHSITPWLSAIVSGFLIYLLNSQ